MSRPPTYNYLTQISHQHSDYIIKAIKDHNNAEAILYIDFVVNEDKNKNQNKYHITKLDKIHKDGWHAIHFSIKYNNFEIFKYLLKIDIQCLKMRTKIGIFNGDQTLLNLAITYRRQEFVFQLIRNRVNLKENQTIYSLLKKNFSQQIYLKMIFLQRDILQVDKKYSQIRNQIQNIKETQQNDEKYQRLYHNYYEVCQSILMLNPNQEGIKQQKEYFYQKFHNIFQQKILRSLGNAVEIQRQKQKQLRMILQQTQINFRNGLKYRRINRQASFQLLLKAKNGYQQAQKLSLLQKKETENYEKCRKILKYYETEKQRVRQKQIHYSCALLSQKTYQECTIARIMKKNQQNKKNKESKQKKVQEVKPEIKLSNQFVKLSNLESEKNFKAGYYAIAYKYIKQNQEIIIISHCGTDPNQNGDIAADFLLIFDLMHTQFSLAKDFVNQVIKLYGQKRIIHTGHSLGAFLAEIQASEHNHQAITFESPGSYDMLVKLNLLNKSKITTYLTVPNFINTIKPHAGTVYRIKIQNLIEDDDQKNTKDPKDKKKQTYFQKLSKIISFQTLFNQILIVTNKKQLYKRFIQLINPLIEILSRDLQTHKIDHIVKYFQQTFDSKRQVIEWPIGFLQYFALATNMIQQDQNDPDKHVQLKETTKDLIKRKALFYKIKNRGTGQIKPKL